MNMNFVNALAWIFGFAATLLLVARVIGYMTYDEIDEAHDALRGRKATFPMLWPTVTAIVCWVWIVTA